MKNKLSKINTAFIQRITYIFIMIMCLYPVIMFIMNSFFFFPPNPIIAYANYGFALIFVPLCAMNIAVNAAKYGVKKTLLRYDIVFPVFIMISAVIVTAVCGVSEESLFGRKGMAEGLCTFLSYFMIFLGSRLIINEKHRRNILLALCFSGIFLLLPSVMHINHIPVMAYETIGGGAFSSVFYQFNHYGYFINLTALLMSGVAAYGKNTLIRIICAVGAAISGAVLTFNCTFGAFLGLIGGIVFIIICRTVITKKFEKESLVPFCLILLGIVFGTICGGGLLYDFSDVSGGVNNIISGSDNIAHGSMSTRWALIEGTLKFIGNHPFGSGAAGLGDWLYTYPGSDSDMPHNEYLQICAFYGLQTLVLYIMFLIGCFVSAVKHRKELSFIMIIFLTAAFGYLVSAVVGNELFYTAPYLFICLGIGTGFTGERITEDVG